MSNPLNPTPTPLHLPRTIGQPPVRDISELPPKVRALLQRANGPLRDVSEAGSAIGTAWDPKTLAILQAIRLG